jgi:hypothetical protein
MVIVSINVTHCKQNYAASGPGTGQHIQLVPMPQGVFLVIPAIWQMGLHWFKKTSRMVLLSVQALEEWIKEG